MSKFKINEIAIIHSKSRPEFNGQETRILSNPIRRPKGLGYKTDNCPDPAPFDLSEWYESALRKLPPADTKLDSWEDCAFIPDSVLINEEIK